MVTTQKLVAKFKQGILQPNDECKINTFVAMDNGKYYIGSVWRNILINELATRQAEGDFDYALVPVIADKTIFFADIDHIQAGNFNLDELLIRIATAWNELATEKVKDVKADVLLVFKREDRNAPARYHIYVTCLFGEVSKAEREAIYKLVNEQYEAPIIDEAAHTIRIEGFKKFDRETSRYVAGSRYCPTGAASQMSTEELLNKVWLNPRGWADDDLAVLNDNAEQGDVPRARLSQLLNDEHYERKDESHNVSLLQADVGAESRSPSLDMMNPVVKDDIVDRIRMT